ncbi:MAG: hypothetical protein J7497_16740, partial [Chitinophagaceae bacterium]|nr:hypothetical protein [Chitinophagaceae bacterium]
LIYSGKSQILSKEVRRIADEVRGEQLYKNIESKTTYYVKHNDQYYPVTNIASLEGVFSDKDKINKILNDNKKKYKKEDLRIVLLDAVTFYDQLTP